MKKKGNTSVPYGSGYEKVEEGIILEYSKLTLEYPDIKKIHKLFKKNKKKLFVVVLQLGDPYIRKNPKDFDFLPTQT